MKTILAITITLTLSPSLWAQLDPSGHITCRPSFSYYSNMKYEKTSTECEQSTRKCAPIGDIYEAGADFPMAYRGDTQDGEAEVYETKMLLNVPGSRNNSPRADLYIDIHYWALKNAPEGYRGIKLHFHPRKKMKTTIQTHVTFNDLPGEHFLQRGSQVTKSLLNPKGLEYTHPEYSDAVLTEIRVTCFRADQ